MFLLAATVLWLSIPHFKEAGDYQLELPNPYNVSFSIVTLLWIAICCVPISKSSQRIATILRMRTIEREAYSAWGARTCTVKTTIVDVAGSGSVVCKLVFAAALTGER